MKPSYLPVLQHCIHRLDPLRTQPLFQLPQILFVQLMTPFVLPSLEFALLPQRYLLSKVIIVLLYLPTQGLFKILLSFYHSYFVLINLFLDQLQSCLLYLPLRLQSGELGYHALQTYHYAYYVQGEDDGGDVSHNGDVSFCCKVQEDIRAHYEDGDAVVDHHPDVVELHRVWPGYYYDDQ